MPHRNTYPTPRLVTEAELHTHKHNLQRLWGIESTASKPRAVVYMIVTSARSVQLWMSQSEKQNSPLACHGRYHSAGSAQRALPRGSAGTRCVTGAPVLSFVNCNQTRGRKRSRTVTGSSNLQFGKPSVITTSTPREAKQCPAKL